MSVIVRVIEVLESSTNLEDKLASSMEMLSSLKFQGNSIQEVREFYEDLTPELLASLKEGVMLHPEKYIKGLINFLRSPILLDDRVKYCLFTLSLLREAKTNLDFINTKNVA